MKIFITQAGDSCLLYGLEKAPLVRVASSYLSLELQDILPQVYRLGIVIIAIKPIYPPIQPLEIGANRSLIQRSRVLCPLRITQVCAYFIRAPSDNHGFLDSSIIVIRETLLRLKENKHLPSVWIGAAWNYTAFPGRRVVFLEP